MSKAVTTMLAIGLFIWLGDPSMHFLVVAAVILLAGVVVQLEQMQRDIYDNQDMIIDLNEKDKPKDL